MFISDRVCVDFVVFSVSPDEADPTDLIVQVELDNQAILVPFYVEHDSIVVENARAWIFLFEHIDAPPFRPFGLPEPNLQLFLTVRMSRPELP
jgi:hypothetical protein